MVATKQQAIGLAIVSVLTLGAGIAVMVLFSLMFEALFQQDEVLPILSVYWPYAIPVLITGVLGLIAAAVRNNIGIGIYMAICIICLVIEAGFVIIFGLVLVVLLAIPVKDCSIQGGVCMCTDFTLTSGGTTLTLPSGSDCVDPAANMLHLTRASCAMIIVSWALMLAGAICSCMACCCGKREQSTVGVVITQGAPQGYEMNYPAGSGYPAQPPQGGYYGPPPVQYPPPADYQSKG